ncbi:MAG TPA: hypothetical protein VK879_05020 [Candidatus Sulfomarinibacteraceae bacterium]|nr:hypothetical protein [Candidatus Sulfomarinibacteraceae bacterium]
MEGQLQQTAGGGFRLLQRALQANALFSGLSGLTLLAAASPVAQLMGLPGATFILRVIGLGLLLYAGFLLYAVRQAPVNAGPAWAAVVMDVLWVVGSAALLLGGLIPFSTEGRWIVAVVADVVAVFAIVQTIGIIKLDTS